MYRIIDNRATGKTSRLMLLAKENNGIIVCKDPGIMKDKAYRYGITGIDFISYSEFDYDVSRSHSFGTNYNNRPVFIDELDLYLQHLGYNIQGYTISNED